MINLMQKWAKKLAEVFVKDSFTAGKASTDYEFEGVKTIKILTVQTQEPGDYTRSGNSRYGTPTDVQDSAQELTMTQDKSFSLVVDKGDNTEQMMLKNAGRVMRRQQRERVIPMIDKHNLKMWARGAGKVVAGAALAKATIVEALLAVETAYEDAFVPASDRYVYMANATWQLFRTAPEFVGCDNITDKLIIKGYKGDVGTLKIVTVPASYMPANAQFVAAYRGSVLAPHKIHEAKVHQDPPGISGHLLEGRDIFDAFVVGTLSDGVYLYVLTGKKGTTPTLTKAATTTLAAGAGETIKYTLDGTDPRYSTTAITYTAAFANPAAGVKVKAVAFKYEDGIYNSDLLVHTAV